MKKDTKIRGKAFRKLVKTKMAERGWNQSQLGAAVGKGRSYMSYLMNGDNPGSRGGKFSPQPDVVEKIADVLGIAVDEAFEAAEIPAGILSRRAIPQDDRGRNENTETEAANAGARETSGGIKIGLADGVHLSLHGLGEDVPEAEIERYSLAFRVAFETVRKT